MANIQKISGRDCLNPVKVSQKINEIIDLLVENEVLTKSEYEEKVKQILVKNNE